MTSTQLTLLIVYAALVAIWPIRHAVISYAMNRLDILTPNSPHYAAENAPLVSAIIPAKDEETTLPECLASVCAQEYPNLEVLVADDRSTDQTAAIAGRFAASDPRVRVITIDSLPPGWTGKTHALHVAAAQARGEWLWFLDADTRHTPASLSVVMEYARREAAALASLLPALRCETFWESAVQPLAGIVLMQWFPLFLVNDNRSRLAFANGQYILVERTAYEAAGGHEAVRERFVEDIGIAQRIKAQGRPIRTAIGKDISETRMYTSLPQLVRGWSRILYDALDRSLWRVAWCALDPLIFSQTGHVALVAAVVMLALGVPGPFAVWLLSLSLVHHLLAVTVLARLYRLTTSNVRSVVWYPLAGLVIDWIVARAVWMCLTGRVTWRGTSYGGAPGEPARGASVAALAPGEESI